MYKHIVVTQDAELPADLYNRAVGDPVIAEFHKALDTLRDAPVGSNVRIEFPSADYVKRFSAKLTNYKKSRGLYGNDVTYQLAGRKHPVLENVVFVFKVSKHK